MQGLVEVAYEDGNFRISGYTSSPTVFEKTRRKQVFFVNGRLVKSRLLEQALADAYHDKLFDGQYPSAFLFLELDPRTLDVNIHPHKTEIRFYQEKEVHEFVMRSVRKALLNPQAMEVRTIQGETSNPAALSEDNNIADLPERSGWSAEILDKNEDNEGVADLYNPEIDGVKMVIPYTINMEKLFEFYVRSQIKEYLNRNGNLGFRLDDYRTNRNNPLKVLKTESEIKNIYIMQNYLPDIAIYRDGDGGKKYVAVFDVKYQYSTSKAVYSTVRDNSHQLLFYALLLNVTTCGFIFPKVRAASDIQEGIPLYIQDGSRVESSKDNDVYYTQWQIDVGEENLDGFSRRMLDYLISIYH